MLYSEESLLSTTQTLRILLALGIVKLAWWTVDQLPTYASLYLVYQFLWWSTESSARQGRMRIKDPTEKEIWLFLMSALYASGTALILVTAVRRLLQEDRNHSL